MIFAELWLFIVDKNPKLKTDKTITMSVDNFRKAIKLAHDEGVKEGKNSLSIFEDMFGRKG
jgi:hypothetical protein